MPPLFNRPPLLFLSYFALFNAYSSNYNAKQLQNVAFYREVSSDLLGFLPTHVHFPLLCVVMETRNVIFSVGHYCFSHHFSPREFLFITEHLLY